MNYTSAQHTPKDENFYLTISVNLGMAEATLKI